MPAIITHHLFGEEAAGMLPDGLLESHEALLAFLLGCQGTDPMWSRFSTLPQNAFSCHAVALLVHSESVTETLLALRETVSSLPEDDRATGRAFALGMSAHYLLDSVAHPLIYALQRRLEVFEPSLRNARSELHAMLEADIDSWMLWQMRQKTVIEAPCSDALPFTPRIGRVAGAMIAQVAWQIYGIKLDAREYSGAVRDYRTLYAHIDPPKTPLAQALTWAESKVRLHSRLHAQAHRVLGKDETVIANLEHDLWRDPYTRVTSTASFPDLFHDALAAWPAFASRLIEGDERRLSAMIDHVNYYGRREPGA